MSIGIIASRAAVLAAENSTRAVPLGHTTSLQHLEFSADGRWLISSEAYDGQVILWSAENGELVRSFDASSFEIAPDGQSLLLIDTQTDPTVPKIFSLATGRELKRVNPEPGGPRILTATFTTDGRYLLLTEGTGGVPLHSYCWLWNINAEETVWAPDMPLPFKPTDDQWQSTFAAGNNWVTQYLRRDRDAAQFCQTVRPDGKPLALQRPLGEYFSDGRHLVSRKKMRKKMGQNCSVENTSLLALPS